VALIHGVDANLILRPLLVDATGQALVTASAWPLPVGAATETTLATLLTQADFDTRVALLATQATLATLLTQSDFDTKASLLSTEATHLLIKTAVQSLVGALVSVATDKLRADIIAALPAGNNNIGDVDVATSALPTGAATETTLATRASQATLATLLLEATFTGRIGEVQVAPTANTLLDRLKQLQDVLASVATDQLRADIIAALPAGNNNIGDVDVVTLPATIALPTGAATSAKQDTQITAEQAVQTSVQIMDDWDETDRAKVNPIVGQAGVAAGAGAVGATVQRATLASDDPAVTSLQIIDNMISGNAAIVNARGGDKIIAYENTVEEYLTNLSLAAGTNNIDGAAVPAGEMWIVQAAGILDVNSIATKVDIVVRRGGNGYTLNEVASPGANKWSFWVGQVALKEGDLMRGHFEGATLNDDGVFYYLGYKMQV
jgi:hypothetical protein